MKRAGFLSLAAVMLFTAASARAAGVETGRLSLAGVRVQDLDGGTVDLQSYLGKGPVVLDFWATWCQPCVAAIPELNLLHDDLAGRGLQIVGINADGQRAAAKVKPFVRTKGMEFPVVLDLNGEAQSRVQVSVLPTTIVLDRDGRILHTALGYRRGEMDRIRALVEPLLAPPDSAQTAVPKP